MTAITTAAPAQIRSTYWLTAVALAFAAIALSAFVVGRVTGSDTSGAGQKSTVQTSQNNQLCAPAPGTRYC
jgi:hypothetical protein